ncbi:MAG: hypothetical protein EZS28_000343, partial [Streblomastix strix]
MIFVLLFAVNAALCNDFIPQPTARPSEQESAFKGKNTINIITNALLTQSALTPLKPTNDECKWNVGKIITGDDSKHKVQDVLDLSPCDGYEITLVDSEHFESVQINKSQDFPVLIKGGAKNQEDIQIHTVWGVNSNEPRTVTLLQGDLTIQNIEFIYFENTDEKQDEQDGVIWPWNAIIYAYDQSLSFRILSLESCIFKGLGSNQSVNKMIYTYNMKKLSITQCTFQDANFNANYSIYYFTSNRDNELIVENSTFVNISFSNSERGNIYIETQDYNQIININGNTFENIMMNESYYSSTAAIYIYSFSYLQVEPNQYIITNNKFINNTGYYAGGIYGYFYYGGIFNFSSNEFSNNSKLYSGNGANDAYLMWYNYPQGWNIDNVKYKILKIFENCTPSNEKNVYYEFRVNGDFEISGYITSGDEEQDPDDNTEPGTEGCIWNVNQTGDGITTKKTIMGVLAGICNEDEGYKVTLLNDIHYESVIINQPETSPVLIKGGAKDEEETSIRTIWGVNTSAARTVTLLQGNLTIQNIEFIYIVDIQKDFSLPENSKQVEEIIEDEVQQNKIKDIVETQNNSYIVVPVDEVYEEETIEVSDDQLFVLQPDSTPGEDNKPVIQPSSEQEQDNPLMIISGNGKVQIDGFVIAHSKDEGKQALIETIGDAVLRLIGVTLSPNKRTKDGNGTHINPTGQSKSSPFLFAAGKQVVIINVTMEPTSFSGCSGIILDGENENTNHSLILETS